MCAKTSMVFELGAFRFWVNALFHGATLPLQKTGCKIITWKFPIKKEFTDKEYAQLVQVWHVQKDNSNYHYTDLVAGVVYFCRHVNKK